MTVSSGLTAAAAPSVSSRVLDVNQTLTVTDHLPTSGTAPYAWTWTVSINGGAYATSTVCSGGGNTGTGGSAGALVTCSVPAGTLTVADHYVFKLAVKDSATLKETETSATSALVTVHSALTAPKAPTVAYTHLALAQTETVTAKIPSTGSSTYSWTWLVSVNGGAFAATGVCSQNSGSGAIGGATITCTIAGLTLTIGDTYAFKLLVQDSATQPETMASAASKTVSVS